MRTKNKLYTVLAVFLILILLTGFGAFKGSGGTASPLGNTGASKGTEGDSKSSSVKIKRLGGVGTRMPEASSLVFFTSTIGQKLTSYKAYKNFDEAVCSLTNGEIDAIWACDVSTGYLESNYPGMVKADISTMADIQKTEEPRFSFGMALKKNKGEALQVKINKYLADMKEDGTLSKLISEYIDNAAFYETEQGKDKRFYPKNMRKINGNTITVGITGAVPPIELLDEDMEPYGFCVALMDELGARLGQKVKFVYLDNETAFTSLMSEKVDMIFAYGTGRITTETKQNFIMTDGYYNMQRYEILTLENK